MLPGSCRKEPRQRLSEAASSHRRVSGNAETQASVLTLADHRVTRATKFGVSIVVVHVCRAVKQNINLKSETQTVITDNAEPAESLPPVRRLSASFLTSHSPLTRRTSLTPLIKIEPCHGVATLSPSLSRSEDVTFVPKSCAEERPRRYHTLSRCFPT